MGVRPWSLLTGAWCSDGLQQTSWEAGQPLVMCHLCGLRLSPTGCWTPRSSTRWCLRPQRDGAAKSMALPLFPALPCFSWSCGVDIPHSISHVLLFTCWRFEVGSQGLKGPCSLWKPQRRILPVPRPAPGVATVLGEPCLWPVSVPLSLRPPLYVSLLLIRTIVILDQGPPSCRMTSS